MKSIYKMLVTSFIVLMVVLLVSLSGFFTLGRLQKHAHQQFFERNQEATQLAAIVSQMNALSTNMLRSSSSDLLLDYHQKIVELEQQIETITANNSHLGANREILRRLNNFNQYQAMLLTNSTPPSYDTLTYIRDSISIHQLAVEELVLNNYSTTSSVYDEYEKKLTTIEYSLWIILLTFIICSSIIGIQTAVKIFHQIDEFHNYALQLSRKNWNIADSSFSGLQELDDLSKAMNEMKREILSYIEQIKEKARLEKVLGEKLIETEIKDRLLMQAQLTNMRSQINPHFLFNALDLIGKVAFLNNPELAMELIEAISKILRYSLDATDFLVPLEKELSIIQPYLFLQKTRFGERIHVRISVQDNAKNWPVPSMLLQPIIENCFTHGIGSKTHLTIHLSARVQNEKLLICVEDDGVGFDTSRHHDDSKQHIGLSNVKTRLMIRYKQPDLLAIESKIGAYTKITLTIPYQEDSA